jgi:hypothetical protein
MMASDDTGIGLEFPLITPFRSRLTHKLGTASLPSLRDLTISQAGEGLRKGKFTSVDLVKAYLKRIEETKHLMIVMHMDEDALEVAQILDKERAEKGSRRYVIGLIWLLTFVAMSHSNR